MAEKMIERLRVSHLGVLRPCFFHFYRSVGRLGYETSSSVKPFDLPANARLQVFTAFDKRLKLDTRRSRVEHDNGIGHDHLSEILSFLRLRLNGCDRDRIDDVRYSTPAT